MCVKAHVSIFKYETLILIFIVIKEAIYFVIIAKKKILFIFICRFQEKIILIII